MPSSKKITRGIILALGSAHLDIQCIEKKKEEEKKKRIRLASEVMLILQSREEPHYHSRPTSLFYKRNKAENIK